MSSSDSASEEGKGYADDKISTSSSSSSYSGVIVGEDVMVVDSAVPLDHRDSSNLLEDSDALEEVAIHVDSAGAWDGKPKDWPVVLGYDWAPPEVRQISSTFFRRRPFKELADKVCLVKADQDASHFKLAICRMTERVCHGRGDYPLDFFYVYVTMFKDLKVLLPFSEFQMGVLRELNVATTQLHPNGWAFMQAFSTACTALALYPTPGDFLYFFHVLPHPSKPWVSLRTISDRQLLMLFNNSYKDFKGNFFKVVPLEDGYSSFCFADGQPKFPFYWTNHPKKGGEIRKTIEGSSSRTPINTIVPVTSLSGQQTQLPPPATEVPTTKSTRPPAAAEKVQHSQPIPKKKGKCKTAWESSVSSKHSKRSLSDDPPLSGPLSSNSWVAKCIHFDLFAEEKNLMKGMTEEEASNMAWELAARSTMKLTLRLAEVERITDEDKRKDNTLLVESRSAQRRLQRSSDDLKLDLQKSTNKYKELGTDRDNLLVERDVLRDRVLKLETDNKFLGDEVVKEHLLGFGKALAQCNVFFQIPLEDPHLDVSMVVMDGKLVPIHVPQPSPLAIPDVHTP
ncbi:hypothetical protein LR48_Vigan10g138000 [Vigna angularis]|uniref:Uncharacterized protein n=1 Tax=Phaseolus angularis TaxID=3914 RepID=A0A0L9VKJ5_PHAAN|nr:hypothetical protein LR48_Vigan10g138000 [Vigna angularis]